MAETGNCAKGYGLTYSNCFGIKNGNTAPCEKIGNNSMCVYQNPEESYQAFKIIWSRWYSDTPQLADASRWTGGDNPQQWLYNVNYYLNQ